MTTKDRSTAYRKHYHVVTSVNIKRAKESQVKFLLYFFFADGGSRERPTQSLESYPVASGIARQRAIKFGLSWAVFRES